MNSSILPITSLLFITNTLHLPMNGSQSACMPFHIIVTFCFQSIHIHFFIYRNYLVGVLLIPILPTKHIKQPHSYIL